MSTKTVTPVGRIVWGNPLQPRPKKDNNGQAVMKDGKAVQEYQFGLAIPKDQFGPLGAVLQQEAAAVSPQGVPQDFAWKIKDGDTGLDRKQQPLRDKTGYAGCFIIAVSTEYPIPVFKREGQAFVQLTQGVKTGDYVRAELTVNGHGRAPGKMGAKPGLYLNPNQVELVGYGEEIRGASNPEDAFGQAAALPQGASAAPVASGPMPTDNASPFAASPPAPAPQQTQQAPAAAPEPHQAFPWGGQK